jgi:histidine triad (HIT) family protein
MATLFSKIAAGDIPSYKCAEDDRFYAFLDINPVVRAHTLVIPRKETDYIFDMDDEELAAFEVFAKKVARAIRAAFPCTKVAQVVLGLEVNHAHIHLMPINSEADVDFHKHVKLSDEEMKATADKIFEEFKRLG